MRGGDFMGGKLLLGLIVIAVGIVIGWYVVTGKINTTKLINTAKTTTGKIINRPTAQPTNSLSVTEEPISGMPTPTGSILTKGGIVTEDKTAKLANVKYAENGFSPLVITVKVGTAVTFTNSSTKNMWVASNPHPAHTGLPGFDELKSVASGGTYTYTFTKVGTWKYHNHILPSDTGTVIVTQ
jgi:plastocyanin